MAPPREHTVAVRWFEAFLLWWSTWRPGLHTVLMPDGSRMSASLVARAASMLYKLAKPDGSLRGPEGGWLGERDLARITLVSRPVLERVMRLLTAQGFMSVDGDGERSGARRRLVIPAEWETPAGWPFKRASSGQPFEYDPLARRGGPSGQQEVPHLANDSGVKVPHLANDSGVSGQPFEYDPFTNTSLSPVKGPVAGAPARDETEGINARKGHDDDDDDDVASKPPDMLRRSGRPAPVPRPTVAGQVEAEPRRLYGRAGIDRYVKNVKAKDAAEGGTK